MFWRQGKPPAAAQKPRSFFGAMATIVRHNVGVAGPPQKVVSGFTQNVVMSGGICVGIDGWSVNLLLAARWIHGPRWCQFEQNKRV
jgi:hypothetical protein